MDFHNITFDVDDNVLELGLTVAAFVMRGLDNKPSTPEFDRYLEQETQRVLQHLSIEDIKRILCCWAFANCTNGPDAPIARISLLPRTF
jgi:hypothetical protein